jgi:membrane associated rhomboid family serine protease
MSEWYIRKQTERSLGSLRTFILIILGGLVIGITNVKEGALVDES